MAFVVDFKLYQVWQDGKLTVRDTSNYGANSNANKSNFLSRKIHLVRANSPQVEVIDFPFLDPQNSIEETIDIDMKSDQAISIRLEVTPVIPGLEPDDVYFLESTAAMTGFIDSYRLRSLSKLDPSRRDYEKVSREYSVVSSFRRSALIRAAQGDIKKSQRLLDFCTNKAKCLC